MPSNRKTVPAAGAKRVTLKFIAEYLNLSPTTVSVVLTNSPLAGTIVRI
jgi:LacI family transcriptional regulator